MARPRCDPFDAVAIRAAIDRGETTERAAYLAYASQAGRPYARSTFALILNRAVASAASDNGALDRALASSDAARRERAPVKPRILALSAGGGLRVKKGSLIAFDGASSLTYSPSAKPPLAIVLSTVGGFVSMEAVRFCARTGVAIIALDRAHGFLTVIGGAPKASASLLRAQVQAEPSGIARAIVAAKICALRQAGALTAAEQFMTALDRAASLDQIRKVEAQASRIAWAANTPALKWDKGPIPSDWRSPWLMRSRLDAKGKRGARHPVNAMLNAAFAVTAGRLTAYLAASGLSPTIGFLHADKRGRWSLAWDAIEPLRPAIEARAFRFIARERFALADFVRAPDGSVRLAPGLLSAVLNECSASPAMLAQCVRWLARLILTADKGSADEPKDGLRDAERGRLAIGGGALKRADAPFLIVAPKRKGM